MAEVEQQQMGMWRVGRRRTWAIGALIETKAVTVHGFFSVLPATPFLDLFEFLFASI